MYTDDLIRTLIKCEKVITVAPPKEYKEDRGHLKKNFTMQSIDGRYTFSVYIRASIHFKENFSIGMDYSPKEEKGSICLLRCNGTHGENIAFPHHTTFHIHKASAETINSGLKPESNIEETTEYASIDEAIQFFCKEVNITTLDIRQYFPTRNNLMQLPFKDE